MKTNNEDSLKNKQNTIAEISSYIKTLEHSGVRISYLNVEIPTDGEEDDRAIDHFISKDIETVILCLLRMDLRLQSRKLESEIVELEKEIEEYDNLKITG